MNIQRLINIFSVILAFGILTTTQEIINKYELRIFIAPEIKLIMYTSFLLFIMIYL